ncbi:hypothetical protein D3C86_1504570 [compost metagenome]
MWPVRRIQIAGNSEGLVHFLSIGRHSVSQRKPVSPPSTLKNLLNAYLFSGSRACISATRPTQEPRSRTGVLWLVFREVIPGIDGKKLLQNNRVYLTCRAIAAGWHDAVLRAAGFSLAEALNFPGDPRLLSNVSTGLWISFGCELQMQKDSIPVRKAFSPAHPALPFSPKLPVPFAHFSVIFREY